MYGKKEEIFYVVTFSSCWYLAVLQPSLLPILMADALVLFGADLWYCLCPWGLSWRCRKYSNATTFALSYWASALQTSRIRCRSSCNVCGDVVVGADAATGIQIIASPLLEPPGPERLCDSGSPHDAWLWLFPRLFIHYFLFCLCFILALCACFSPACFLFVL